MSTTHLLKTERIDSFALRMERIKRVEELAKEAGKTAVYDMWRMLHKRSEGEGTAVCLDPDMVKAGEGLLWHESTKEPGRLFLFSPQRAVAVLEHRRRVNGGVNGHR